MRLASGQTSIFHYIISNVKLSTMVLDARFFLGPENKSNYFLVESKTRYWPRWRKKQSPPRTEDTYCKMHILQDPSIRWL